MTVKGFFKSTSFKCIITLLCILLISGLFLTVAYGFLEVTEGEKLQRAIGKIYDGQTPEIHGKDDVVITATDKQPKGLLENPLAVDSATVKQAYKIVLGSDTDYLILSEGGDGYGGGTVTCWVAVTVNLSASKIAGIRKVSISENSGQSFIGKITDGFLNSFSEKYSDEIYFSTGDGFLSSGATKSSNAICNSVNGATAFINRVIFEQKEVNKFEGFSLLTYTNSNGSKVSSINVKTSDYTVENGVVTYTLVTASEDRPNPFTVEIKVGAEKTILSYKILKNGSAPESYANRMPESIKDGTMFTGWSLSNFTAVLGTELNYASIPEGEIHSGATQSNALCLVAGAFAVANYDNCINAGGTK